MDKQLRVEAHGLTLQVPGRRQPGLASRARALLGGNEEALMPTTILSQVTCAFGAGKLTALMGPSGAGKTSLLKLMAGDRPKRSTVSGTITVNGQAVRDGGQMKRISAMVFQDDVLLPTMTVREAISFAARLKQQPDVAEKTARVIQTLGLGKVADSAIGEPSKKGLSGGERKRVCIAMQLVTDPPILFLDEPTSGLDALTAAQCVEYLQTLCRTQGKTIIATIHQPSSKVFHMFDQMVLMAGGQIVYEGSVDESVAYFASQGFECPQFVNPADFLFMEVLHSPESIGRLQAAWTRPALAYQPPPLVIKNVPATRQAPFRTQFAMLLQRSGRALVRNRMILRLRLVRALFFGCLVASIYYEPGGTALTPEAQIQNRVSSMYFLLTNEMFGGVAMVISLFTTERAVFLREHRNGYYGVLAYFLSKLLVELPLQFVFPLLTLAVPYYVIGYQPTARCIATACLIFVMIANTSAGMGILLGAAFARIETALAVMPMLLLPLMVFGGLLVNLANVPWYFVWLKHISPVKRAFVALAKNELTGLTFAHCTPPPTLPDACTGEEALRRFSLDAEPSVWHELAVLGCMYAVLLVLGFLGLLRIARMRK